MTRPYPLEISQLVQLLQKLPGVGKKTAERFAFEILTWDEQEAIAFASHLQTIKQKLSVCTHCNCIVNHSVCSANSCYLDGKSQRDSRSMCIVSSAKDVFAIEESQCFNGIYYVLQGLISPMAGQDIEVIQLDKILERISTHGVEEIVLALDSTLEGDATSLYLKKQLEAKELHVTRLATGMPIGSSLDFLDGATLSRAFTGRSSV